MKSKFNYKVRRGACANEVNDAVMGPKGSLSEWAGPNPRRF